MLKMRQKKYGVAFVTAPETASRKMQLIRKCEKWNFHLKISFIFHLKISYVSSQNLDFLLIIFLLESVPSPLEKNKILKIKYRSMKCEKSKTDTAQN